jgi:2-polyprenyl-6-methoxyphenol hydroxylase-like FAD-dependent oxidoreductase
MRSSSVRISDEQRVLIVGAGTGGLATALEFAHHGVHGPVVEDRPDASWLQPGAKATSAPTTEHFRHWRIVDTVCERALLRPNKTDVGHIVASGADHAAPNQWELVSRILRPVLVRFRRHVNSTSRGGM